MPERIALARKIKAIRRQMCESQIEFAAHCGISTEALSLIKREQTDPQALHHPEGGRLYRPNGVGSIGYGMR